VGAYDAKTHLPQLLERVAGGERITITRHGIPIATLQPAHPAARMTAGDTIEKLKEFRRGKRLGGLSIREMIEEGRR
jgi:prevent-host-death family protein